VGTKRVWAGINKTHFPTDWYLEGTSQGSYLTKYIFNAKLEKLEKLYLCYVAAMTRFKDHQPCYASRDEIMNALSISKDTLNRVKRKLIELDWIVVYERPGTSDLQFPSVGKDDPNFKWKNPERKIGREPEVPI
jgi:hypothetical protein